MENKILINLIVPTLETSYNIFIPISKRVGNIIQLLIKAINELGTNIDFDKSILLYNRNTGQQYNPNDLIYDTDIRNGTELILL